MIDRGKVNQKGECDRRRFSFWKAGIGSGEHISIAEPVIASFDKGVIQMLREITSMLILFSMSSFGDAVCGESYTLRSPDNNISANVWLTSAGSPVYSVSYLGSTILKESKLGIARSDEDFSSGMTLDSASAVSQVSEKYTLLHGKRLACSYTGSKRIFFLKSAHSESMEIIFQVSNDGVAFRYYFPGKTDTTATIYSDATSFHFARSTKAFLQPCADARMGWSYASPSYEEYHKMDIPVGTPSPNQAGWVMPALFHSGNNWICITETAVDTNYCGSRLSQFSPAVYVRYAREVDGGEVHRIEEVSRKWEHRTM